MKQDDRDTKYQRMAGLPSNPPYHRTEQMVCFDPKLSEGQPAIASKLMQLYGIKKVRKVGDPGGE